MRIALARVCLACSLVVLAPAQEVATFLPEHALQWGKETAASGARARAAVIVTADRYSSEQAWDLPASKRSGELLRDALVQHAGLPRGAISMLSDEKVHAGAIEAAIQRAGQSIGAEGTSKQGVLLLFWIGHGYTDAGQQQLFGYYTQRAGARYAPVIGQAQLVAWLNRAHDDAKARGVELVPVVVYDVCRPSVQLAPPADAVAVQGKCWQVFGVSKGGYAEAKGDICNFCGALAESFAVRAKQTGSADLAAVFREAKDLTEQRTNRAQIPELIAPEDQALARASPPLVQPRRIAFTVRLVDALSQGRVERAKVRLNDQEHDLTDARLVLGAAPGIQYQLEIRADGYLARAETLTLTDAEADREVVVPLLPHVTVLRARVTPPRVVQVRAAADGAREGYHVMDATTDAKGEVELRLPAGGQTFRLQIVRAGRALQTLQVDNQPSRWLRDGSGRHTGIPLVQQPLALDKAALDQLGADALPVTIKDAAAPKEMPQLADAFERADWQAAQQNIAAEKWDLARQNLLNIEGGGDVSKQWRRYVEARWARAGLERALEAGKRAGEWSIADEVLAWWKGNPAADNKEELARLVAEIEQERVPLAVRKAFEQGIRAYAAGELEQALTLYKQAQAQANAYYGKLITEQVDEIRARLYTRHLLAGNQHEADGDKEKALASYLEAQKHSERAKRYVERLRPAGSTPPQPAVSRATAGQTFTTGIGLTMLWVGAQEFRMGSPEGEAGRDDDEKQHRVKITKGYWLGETEVTQGQWKTVMGTIPWYRKRDVIEADEVAATYVTWNDAVEFCRKLTEGERVAGRLPPGYRYILPTEAEWELACRAGRKVAAYSFGDSANVLKQFAVFAASRTGEFAHVVKSRKANDWGFFDMHGNVLEWCLDEADYKSGVVTDTYRDGIEDPCNRSSSLRVNRGGSWHDSALGVRSAHRGANGPGSAFSNLGLRPALSAGAAHATSPIDAIDTFITSEGIEKGGDWKTRLNKPPKLAFDDKTYYWVLKTNKGEIKIKLLPKSAPMHVSSVIYLARLGFYDGLKFHRAIKGFMAQGGDPIGTGTGGPGYSMDLEIDPALKHDHAGVVSAARGSDVNSTGSQFFIMYEVHKHLDQKYSIFGDVVAGMETIKAMDAVSHPTDGPPLEELRIDSSTIVIE